MTRDVALPGRPADGQWGILGWFWCAGDPSLRLKNGCAQDDAAGNQDDVAGTRDDAPEDDAVEFGLHHRLGSTILYGPQGSVILCKRHIDNRLKTGVHQASVSQRAQEIPH